MKLPKLQRRTTLIAVSAMAMTLVGVLLGPQFVAGSRARVLRNGDEIFPAMLAAIRSAQTTITFETYIYWSGDIGREFAVEPRRISVLFSIRHSMAATQLTSEWPGETCFHWVSTSCHGSAQAARR